jgi:basic membrane lipoprotein Med (substrate-binding protein (PBP1-ABC) superfamily)
MKFEHATGYKRAENVATYDARFYEGRAVIGTIAGRMTKSNKIGYIGSFPIPEVIQGINSAYIHAKKVNPNVEMKVVWVYSWFDPAKEADAAAALIAEGVDVFMQHTDSTAPLAKAQEAGALGFGQASDMAPLRPRRASRRSSTTGRPITSSASARFWTAPGNPKASGRHRRRRGEDRRDHRGRPRRGQGRGRGPEATRSPRANTTPSPAR